MPTDISGKPETSKRVRSGGGVMEERQEERGEEDSMENIYEEPDGDEGPGSQGVTGDQELIMQRERNLQRELTIHRDTFRAAAVCLMLLFAIFTVRTTDKVMDYNSANNPTLCQTKYDNLTLEKNLLQTRHDNLTLKIDQLESEVNQLRRETAVKSCPSGWKKFGCSCYYRSTEKKTWEESSRQCLKKGAHLVIIHSEEEQEFIRGLNQGDALSWIGLKKTMEKWTWVDGSPLTTGNLDNGQSGNCACAYHWHENGEMSCTLCSVQTFWICEKCCPS